MCYIVSERRLSRYSLVYHESVKTAHLILYWVWYLSPRPITDLIEARQQSSDGGKVAGPVSKNLSPGYKQCAHLNIPEGRTCNPHLVTGLTMQRRQSNFHHHHKGPFNNKVTPRDGWINCQLVPKVSQGGMDGNTMCHVTNNHVFQFFSCKIST